MCHWRMVDFFVKPETFPRKRLWIYLKSLTSVINCECRKEREGQVCSIIYLYTIHLLSIYFYLNSIIHSSRGLDISNKLSECYHRESDALFLGWLEKWLLLSRLWTSDTWWPRIFLDINLECPFVLDPLSSIRSLRHLNQNRWSK